jgi:4-alpha-glucanotransferase
MDNFGFTHKSGILMAVSSLPSPYGIGTFGKPCYRWIDFLASTKTTCWQVLPLNPTSYGDSPYQSPAADAGNPYFIDLDDLAARGLLTKEDLQSARFASGAMDYGWLFNTRIDLLRKAYARFAGEAWFTRFCHQNAWVDDYALFMALKCAHDYRPWLSWEDEYKYYDRAKAHAADFAQEMGFWRWVQYTFARQWRKVQAYAHRKGITIIGDMPIYVAYDSVDVWRNPSIFLLDERLNPTFVAGCPPDGFSPDGQMWGNPLYNWKVMREQGFDWWVKRIAQNMRLYDILRIDHFRGFAGYYCIPYGDETARNGHWESCPGKELFATVKERLPNARIIAEDLGFLTPDVRELLDFCGYPGMKILQFAFFDDDSEYLPRMYTTDNCLVYTGSHDSDCTRTFCRNLEGEVLTRFKQECHAYHKSRTQALIDMALDSRANLAVIPLQDWLALTNEQGRMNTPSVPYGNWTWRVKRIPGKRIRALIKAKNKEFGRAK